VHGHVGLEEVANGIKNHPTIPPGMTSSACPTARERSCWVIARPGVRASSYLVGAHEEHAVAKYTRTSDADELLARVVTSAFDRGDHAALRSSSSGSELQPPRADSHDAHHASDKQYTQIRTRPA
jgi:hypothetical protein